MKVPVLKVPVLKVPVLEIPVLEIPVLEIPVLEIPVLEVPVLEVPVLEVPVLEVPVLEVPVLEVPALTVRTLTVLMPVTLLMLMLVVLPTPVLQHRPEHRPEPAVPPATFLAASDTINGERITDRALVQRIERIAAGVPSSLLASHSRAAPVRYLAQGFGAGDDAPVFQGVFRDPAAALAFGCALDVDIGDHCEITPVAVATATYEEVPGVRCVPLSFALGAPAFEPDRCEAGG